MPSTLWRNLTAFGLLLAVLSAAASSSTEGAAKLGFGTDKGAALKQAAAEHRALLAFFTTDW
jgi:hypothetical protein